MKVVIATPYFNPKIGGLELYAEHIAHGLATAGWEVHVITSGATVSHTKQGNITVHTLKTWLQIANTPVNPQWVLQARKLIKALKPDIINVHAPVPSMALAVAAAAGDTPVVVTYHAGSMHKGSLFADMIIGVYERLFMPALLARSSAVICASDFVRLEFLTQWSNKTITITPGVDTDVFVPAPSKRVPGRVVFIGDFRDPRKGLPYLLTAISNVPGASLRVIGPGSGTATGKVSYAGVLRGDDLVEELQTAQMLVLPSTTDAESFGMVLIEAMATAIPVIGTRVGGVPYVITENRDGLLVMPFRADQLATAIHALFKDTKLCATLGANGRAKAAQSYQWDERIQRTENLFKKVLLEVSNV